MRASDPGLKRNQYKSFVDLRHGAVLRHSVTASQRNDAEDRLYKRPEMNAEEISVFKSKWRRDAIKRNGIGKVGEIFGWRESTWDFYMEAYGLVPRHSPDSETVRGIPTFRRSMSAPESSLSGGDHDGTPRPRHPSRARLPPRKISPTKSEGKIEPEKLVAVTPIYAKRKPTAIGIANNGSTASSFSKSNHILQGTHKILQPVLTMGV
jgi:hypothetical protein